MFQLFILTESFVCFCKEHIDTSTVSYQHDNKKEINMFKYIFDHHMQDWQIQQLTYL